VDTTLYEFDPLEPGDPRSVGGYPLRARIGAGGMGRVYLSFTPGGRPVAVKLIRGELASDPEFRERFAREVSIAQQVNGIHIAQLIDSGSDRGVPWLASAYVAGPSLAQVVSACGALPPATVLALAGRIAESLAAIHATGMVHRDLKPGNILLDESGPKVIDFGIVRAATPTATGRSSHRTFIGSPPFMAPEQIRGRKVTPATDVFALGATIYYLSTGESAFQADFADGVLYRVMHDEPDYEACPEPVRELIRACLRKEPEERPTTQRIIEGCRAAGAGPVTPLPDAVRAMIQARAQALAMVASRPVQTPSPLAAPGDSDETEQETGTDPGQLGQTGQAGRLGQMGAGGLAPGEAPVVAAVTPTRPDDLLAAPAAAAAPAATTAAATALSASPTVPEQGATADLPTDTAADTGTDTADTAAGTAADTAPAAWAPAANLLPPTVPISRSDPGKGNGGTGTEAIAPPPRRRRGRTLLVAASSSLVTAVAAVVVAALLWPSPTKIYSDGPGPNSSTSASPATDTATDTAAAPSNTSDSTSGTPDSSTSAAGGGTSFAEVGGSPVQWQGSVLISFNDVDLDSVPVNNNASENASIVNSSSPIQGEYSLESLPFQSPSLAIWSGSTSPTWAQCYSQVSSQGVDSVDVTDATMVCVSTVGGRIALLKVTDDQADGDVGVLAEVTVWSQIATPSAGASTS
jgi:hypothetical protein